MRSNRNKIIVWILISVLVFSIFSSINLKTISQNIGDISQDVSSLKDREMAVDTEIFDIEPQELMLSDEYKFKFVPNLIKTHDHGTTWDLIELEDCYLNPIPWTPQVPLKSLVITTNGELVDIELIFSEPMRYNDVHIAPAPVPQVLNGDLFNLDRSQNLDDGQNENYRSQDDRLSEYQKHNAFFPDYDYLVTGLDKEIIDGEFQYNYGLLIFPCKYNPYLCSALLFQQVEITVFYSTIDNSVLNDDVITTSQKNTRGSESSNDDQHININSGDLTRGDGFKYLILTTTEFVDELKPLANWKQRKGVPTKIVDIETIYQNETFHGYDKPEELRNFIQYVHKNNNTEYVLLAGDWDTVPTRMCYDPDPYYSADDGEIPADSYYACISEGTTWDADEDHIYGELGDLDDKIPDIIVSRIAIDSELKMSEWVKEVIAYECSPPEVNWTEKVILVGPNVHSTGDGAKQSEYFYNKYLKFIYGSFDKFYESSDQGNKQFSRSELTKSMNQGTTFLNYLGHGSPTVWTYNYGYNVLMDKGDVGRLRNRGMKPVVYAMSCLTGWFDDPSGSGYGNFGDCIGESYTEDVVDGGIGYIGSARTSVGSINQNYGPFATGLQEDFIRQLSLYNFGLGSAFTEGKKHYSEVWGNYFEDTNSYGEIQACWLEVNLLGEPELTLWTQKPEQFDISNITSEDSLIIRLKNDTGDPVKNAKVCIQFFDTNVNLNYINVQITDSSGEANFLISGYPSKLNLTVTKTNFIPYLERMTISDMIPPITTLEIAPNEPDGDMGWYITPPKVNLTMDEEGATYYYWDDSTEQLYTGSFTPLEGNHELFYYSVDLAGNIEFPQKVRIKMDISPPESQLELIPEEPNGRNGWYISQPIINITKEPGATIYYAFDSDLFITFSNPITAPIGVHELHYYSKDIAGNLGNITTEMIKIDVEPPKTNIIFMPDEPAGKKGWYTEPPEISLTSEEGAQIYYYWSSNENNTDISNAQLYNELIGCPEGKNELHYFSIDIAGCQEITKSYIVKLDTSLPKTSWKLSTEEPDGENGYYVSDLEIYLSSDEIGQIYYSWDGDYFQVVNGPIKALQGENTLTFYSVDEAGNTGIEKEIILKVDTVPPTTSMNIDPLKPTGEDGWYDINPIITFNSEPTDTVYYHFEWFDDSIATSTIEIPEGVTKLFYHSVDEAGNVGEQSWVEIKVDITPPIPRLEADQTKQIVGNVITFTAGESEDNNEVKQYFVDYGDGENSGWTQTSFFKHIYIEPGEYEVTLYVRDSAGLENEPDEQFHILVVREKDEADLFSSDNITLMLVIIISIFIVLSVGFAFSYKRYNYNVETMNRSQPRSNDYHPVGFEQEYEPDFAEAIVVDRPIVFKMQKVICPGCGKIFMADEGVKEIKCPSCGLSGEMSLSGSNRSSSITDMHKSHSSKLSNGRLLKDDGKLKFKCPNCNCIFQTAAMNKTIKCPNCGIEGEL